MMNHWPRLLCGIKCGTMNIIYIYIHCFFTNIVHQKYPRPAKLYLEVAWNSEYLYELSGFSFPVPESSSLDPIHP